MMCEKIMVKFMSCMPVTVFLYVYSPVFLYVYSPDYVCLGKYIHDNT